MEEFALLMLLGVRVREVRDLDEGAIYVATHKLLIIDVSLTSRQRREAAEMYLSEALLDDDEVAAG